MAGLDQVLDSSNWLGRICGDGRFSGPELAAHVAVLKPCLKVKVVKSTDTEE